MEDSDPDIGPLCTVFLGSLLSVDNPLIIGVFVLFVLFLPLYGDRKVTGTF